MCGRNFEWEKLKLFFFIFLKMFYVFCFVINNELFVCLLCIVGDEWLLDIIDNGFFLLFYYINVLRYVCEKYDVVLIFFWNMFIF